MDVLVPVVCLRNRENLQKEWGGGGWGGGLARRQFQFLTQFQFLGRHGLNFQRRFGSLVGFQEDLGQVHQGVGLGVS
jgi:hypothetical protein